MEKGTKKYRVLLLGSGGREHALAWKIRQSSLLGDLFIAPGNAGTKNLGKNVEINLSDFAAIRDLISRESINLMIVGPEEPLVKGIRDYLESFGELNGLIIIGPGKAGAALEGSKDFAKRFMARHGIPTAGYATFTRETYEDGLKFLKKMSAPYVLKADGLAAGKGVVICNSSEEAGRVLESMLISEKFGEASKRVVIEEFLEGIELSVFILTDGKNYTILPEAKDYKRVGEGDTGPNTGGMGSVSPVPFATPEFMNKVENRIIRPTVHGLLEEGIKYEGFIFIGLMNIHGDPYVIEYNVRMGDPETEVVIPRIKSDLLELLLSIGQGRLHQIKVQTDPNVSTCIMLVSGGYPGDYQKGFPIQFSSTYEEGSVFHAGTKYNEGKIVTAGGRVLAVTSSGATIQAALDKCSQIIRNIHFERMYYRSDIGLDLVKPQE